MKHQPVTEQGSPPVPSEATASPLILKITWAGHVCPEIYKPNHSESLNHFPCPVVKVESFPSRYEPAILNDNEHITEHPEFLFVPELLQGPERGCVPLGTALPSWR